jgi:CubicO group peptidase (beta-lactamase class C family)
MRSLVLVALGLSLGGGPARAQSVPLPCPDTLGLTTALQRLWHQSALPGFAVALIRPGGIVYEHGFGYANQEHRVPYTPATVQPVASVSKTLLGVALVQALTAGQLRLDQPVNELLPFTVVNPYFPTQPITLRHLATMTAGLTDDQRFYNQWAYVPGDTSSLSNEEYLRRTLTARGPWYRRQRFLPHAPGTYYAYSNESAALVGLALERARSTVPIPPSTFCTPRV